MPPNLFTSAPLATPLTPAARIACLRLIRSEGVGPATFHDLIAHTGSPEAALAALPELARRGGRARGIRICTSAQAEAEMEAAERIGASLLFSIEPAYPAALAAVDAPPPLIYVKGDAALLARAVLAVVGSRQCSAAGHKLAGRFARALGEAGLVIASGLARGIDAAAHEAALATGTIAVVAGGIDNIYPPEHADLHRRIAERGCIVSEMPPGFTPRAQDFPRRNRIISGLSRGVLVIEAARRSGTLVTARLAGEQGREVFAVPGNPLDPRAEGTNQLLKSGATLVTAADDILEALRPSLGDGDGRFGISDSASGVWRSGGMEAVFGFSGTGGEAGAGAGAALSGADNPNVGADDPHDAADRPHVGTNEPSLAGDDPLIAGRRSSWRPRATGDPFPVTDDRRSATKRSAANDQPSATEPSATHSSLRAHASPATGHATHATGDPPFATDDRRFTTDDQPSAPADASRATDHASPFTTDDQASASDASRRAHASRAAGHASHATGDPPFATDDQASASDASRRAHASPATGNASHASDDPPFTTDHPSLAANPAPFAAGDLSRTARHAQDDAVPATLARTAHGEATGTGAARDGARHLVPLPSPDDAVHISPEARSAGGEEPPGAARVLKATREASNGASKASESHSEASWNALSGTAAPASVSDAERARVLAALGPAPADVDSVARATDLSIQSVHVALLELSLGGHVLRYPGGLVALAPEAEDAARNHPDED